jgi:streptogramin lyase
VRGLVLAQSLMEGSWCAVYLATQDVVDRFPPARRNLRPAAVAAAQAYMEGYRSSCRPAPAAAAPRPGAPSADPQLNQIYRLARHARWLVAGTQGGVAVWDAATGRQVAAHKELICSHVVVHGGAAWAGCDTSVVRWDGKAFKTYLDNTANDATYYAPFLGPRGELWIRYGGAAWAYDPARDTFVPRSPLWVASPYDVLVRRTGQVWWIDFLRALHGHGKTYPLRSDDYPGSDPRAFYEDDYGRLWVADFGAGLYWLDEATGRFVQEPGLGNKGTAVAVDRLRDRVWLLHYTRGVVLKQRGVTIEDFDLKDQQNMRHLVLDPSGAVWIGGWRGIVRLHEVARGKWQRTTLVVGP